MRYLSKCPRCQTIYHLSLMQMNISQGQVRCAHCETRFDAYRSFIYDPEHVEAPAQNYITEIILPDQHTSKTLPASLVTDSEQSHYVHGVMEQSIEGSRLNLYTYLNYLDLVSPVHAGLKNDLSHYALKSKKETALPNLSKKYKTPKRRKKNKFLYYLVWSIINLGLIGLLAFQFLYLK